MRQQQKQLSIKGRRMPTDITVTATEWHEPIYVSSGRRRWKLKNWYAIDFLYGRAVGLSFTWGYHGMGPNVTAYSILHEFYGKETAFQYFNAFVDVYISKLPEDKGFSITREEMDDLMPDIVLRKYEQ
jgi:hypothetical protein